MSFEDQQPMYQFPDTQSTPPSETILSNVNAHLAPDLPPYTALLTFDLMRSHMRQKTPCVVLVPGTESLRVSFLAPIVARAVC